MASENPFVPAPPDSPLTPPVEFEEDADGGIEEEETEELGDPKHPIVQSESWKIFFEGVSPLADKVIAGWETYNQTQARELEVKEKDIAASVERAHASLEERRLALEERKLEINADLQLKLRQVDVTHAERMKALEQRPVQVAAEQRADLVRTGLRGAFALSTMAVGLVVLVSTGRHEIGWPLILAAGLGLQLPVERLFGMGAREGKD